MNHLPLPFLRVFRGCLAFWLILGIFSAALAEEKKAEAKKAENAATLSVVDPVTKRKLGKLNRMEQAILKLTNRERKKHDKPALTAVSHLNVIAQQHAINMARQQKMDHKFDDKSVQDRLKGVGYKFGSYGENLAAGYKNEKIAVQGWMKSPPHRENILDEKDLGFTQIGIGVQRAANGVWYYCQVFARPATGTNYE